MGSGFCKPTTTHITWHPTITISLCFTNVYPIHFKFEFEIISYRKFYKVIDLNWKLFLITISEECLINLALLGKLSLIGHKLLRNVICRYKLETNMLVIDQARLGLVRIDNFQLSQAAQEVTFRPAICYELSASGYWKMSRCPQTCVITKANNATKQQELYKSCVSWIYFDTLWKWKQLFYTLFHPLYDSKFFSIIPNCKVPLADSKI